MQRRAAAMYFVFFLVIGAGAYGYVTVVDAQRPEVSLDGPTYGAGDTFGVGDQTYEVASIESAGDGEASFVAEVTWTNESARFTGTIENNATVTRDDREWRVVIENRSDVSEFRLRERLNVSAVLAADPEVEDDPLTRGDEQFVRYQDGSTEPLDRYLPEPEERTVAEGDSFTYEGEEMTVAGVTPTEVTLERFGEREKSLELEEGTNVTLGGQQYFAHFPAENRLQLGQDYEQYTRQLDRQAYFHERKNGLWGVSIISTLAAIILLGAAYLPVKD